MGGRMKQTVLIAENNTAVRKSFTSVLEHAGYEVRELPAAPELLKGVREVRPDALLVHVETPLTWEVTLSEEIRSDRHVGQIILLGITGTLPKDQEAKLLRAGFDGFFSSWVSEDEVLKGMEYYLSMLSTDWAVPLEGGRKATILIVDDDKVQVKILEAHLRRAGYKVISAYDGEEALQRVEAHAPDLILLDVMMPKMDGISVCQELRKLEGTKHTPIIMITAIDDFHKKMEALKSGADDFISKPYHALEVLARVGSLLRASRYYSRFSS